MHSDGWSRASRQPACLPGLCAGVGIFFLPQRRTLTLWTSQVQVCVTSTNTYMLGLGAMLIASGGHESRKRIIGPSRRRP